MRSSALAPWLVAGLLASAHLTSASAARAEEPAEEGAEKSATPQDGAEASGAEEPKNEDMAGWGVGGTESEGKFKPQGKTGKLKELETEKEEERITAETPLHLGGPGMVWADMVLAPSGSIVVPIQDSGPTAVAPGVSFLVGASYRIKDKWELGLRYGVGSASVNGPRTPLLEGARDPDGFKQIASGNLELSLRPFFKLKPALAMPIGLALVLPTAMGDMFAEPDTRVDLARWNVNQASAAARGWEDRAMWEPNRFSVVPSAGLLWERAMGSGIAAGTLKVEGRTKLEIMALTGGKDPSVDPASQKAVGDVKDVAVNWVLGGSAAYAMFDGLLQPGLKAWLAYTTPTSTFGTLDNAGAQLVFEPGVASTLAFSKTSQTRLHGRLAGTFPVGGPLGSGNQAIEAGIAGLKLSVGLQY